MTQKQCNLQMVKCCALLQKAATGITEKLDSDSSWSGELFSENALIMNLKKGIPQALLLGNAKN